MIEDKVFFLPGDVVTIKHNIDNKPTMVVKGKDTKMIKPSDLEDKKGFLNGIKCYWFTTTGQYQESIFNTKDLSFI